MTRAQDKNLKCRNLRIFIYTLVLMCLSVSFKAFASVETAATVAPVAKAQIKPIETHSTTKISNKSDLVSPQMETQSESSISLSFPWNIPVGLAVFQRGDYLWIVFDHAQTINVD